MVRTRLLPGVRVAGGDRPHRDGDHLHAGIAAHRGDDRHQDGERHICWMVASKREMTVEAMMVLTSVTSSQRTRR